MLLDKDGEPRSPEFGELPYGHETAHLADVLQRGFHFDVGTHKDPSSTKLGELVESAIRAHHQDDVVLIHVLTHGVPNPDFYGMYAIGNDGERVKQADVANWLMVCAERARNGPHVLFLLDLCGAGEAVRFDDAIRRTKAHRTWIVAAAHAGTGAFDARFTRAVGHVLERVTGDRRPGLDLSSGHRFLPLDTFARQVGTTVTDLADAEGRAARQTVTGTRVDIAASDVVLVPFFPNPRYRAEAPAPRVVPSGSGYDRQAGHFLSAASGHPVAEAGNGLFTGRTQELNTLFGRLTGEPATLVVTGRAGVGKSALLGMLVCTTHPQLSTVATEMTRPLAVPLPQGRMAAVTARELDLTAIVVALGAQLKGARDARTPQALIDAIRRHGEQPVLVVDALEEALDPSAVLTELLLPLSSPRICRLLVAARSAESVAGLPAEPMDLDSADPEQLRDDLEEYATRLLRRLPPYSTSEYVSARAHLAAAIAEALTSGERSVWGEYLITRLYVQHIADREPVRDEAAARELGRSVPLNPADLLDADLSRRPSWVRPVLSAVAWAHGDGMPSEVMPAVASACTDDPHLRPTDEQVADILATNGSYLRRMPGSDGFVRYQLFHEGLADRLRDRSRAAAVFDALISTVPGRWDLASPYVRQHALDHARDADQVDKLVLDPAFLLSGPPEDRIASFEQLGDRAAAQVAVLKAARAMPDDIDPDRKRAELAVEALRHRSPELAGALSGGLRPIWHVALPTGRDAPESSRSTPMLVVTGGTSRVEVYHLSDPPNLAYSYKHVSSIRCVATARYRNENEILCGGNDHSISVWPLRHVSVPRLVLKGHRGPVRCITSTVVGEQTIAVSGGADRTVRLWDLETGELLDTITTYDGPILDLAVMKPPNRRKVVVARTAHGTHTRDLLEPRRTRENQRLQKDDAVLFPLADDNAALITIHGDWSTAPSRSAELRVNDLSSHKLMKSVRQQGMVTAVCTGQVAGQPTMAVATSDGSVWLHGLDSDEPPTSFPLSVQARGLALTEIEPTARVPAARSIAAGPGYGGTVLAVGDRDSVHVHHPATSWSVTAAHETFAAVQVRPLDDGAVVHAHVVGGRAFSFHPLSRNALDLPVPPAAPVAKDRDWVLTAHGAITARIDNDGALTAGAHRLVGHHGAVRCVAAWRWDGRALVVSGGADSTMRIWDAERGLQLRRFWLPAPANAIRASGSTVLVDMAEEAIAFELREEHL
ncbi:hypothetical protein ALI144C_02200 [Actinosynnema sp. ALI-1.44]|uniref:AAA family ATPase n=1 Tax=Actinosynnema sp. ALI-1.44 TaxID=1933779 RepID=UPI00097CB6D7|nr:AAA family ATPase [Actinosynnema sp. ALI-1.44]ONI90789.1 hypothetical protein ALI144C_02200 [Actinosynnema sp. ALI-1.44]